MSEPIIHLPENMLEVAIYDHAYLKHHVRQDCYNNPKYGEGWDIQEPEELIDIAKKILSDPDTEFYLRQSSSNSGTTAYIYHHESRGLLAINENAPESASFYPIEMIEDQREGLQIDLDRGISYQKIDAQQMQAWLDRPQIREKIANLDSEQTIEHFNTVIHDAWRRRLRTDVIEDLKQSGLAEFGLVRGKFPNRQLPEETMAFIDQAVDLYRNVHPHAFSDTHGATGRTAEQIHDSLVKDIETEIVNERNGKPITLKRALQVVSEARKIYQDCLINHPDVIQAIVQSDANRVCGLPEKIQNHMATIYDRIQEQASHSDAFALLLENPKYAKRVSFDQVGTEELHRLRRAIPELNISVKLPVTRIDAPEIPQSDNYDIVSQGQISDPIGLLAKYNDEAANEPLNTDNAEQSIEITKMGTDDSDGSGSGNQEETETEQDTPIITTKHKF